MDTGEGGADNNLFYGNDFSFAPANGMEATFSSNRFVGNRVEGSDYGSGAATATRHRSRETASPEPLRDRDRARQGNLISNNHFDGDSTAISLWANPIEPSDWLPEASRHAEPQLHDRAEPVPANHVASAPRPRAASFSPATDSTG